MSTAQATHTNITPALPVAGRDNAAWAASVLGGRFYLAWLGYDSEKNRESRSILRYVPGSGKWETVFQKAKSLRRDRHGDRASALPADLSASLTLYPTGEREVLYARFSSPLGEAQLRSTEDGKGFRSVRAEAEEVAAARQLLETVDSSEARYALFARNGHPALSYIVRQKETMAWSELAPPSPPSRIAIFNEQLVVSSDDAIRGFEVWAMSTAGGLPGKWRSLLARGGYRFSVNASVLACLPWRDALYIACGGAERRGGQRHQEGFEILRVYPDSSWDLIVGAPRVSGTGLKVPLAGLGPGTDEFRPSEFRFLTATESDLQLGTYEDTAGFCIWRSSDGLSWTRDLAPEFAALEKVKAASAFQIREGTLLLLELESPLRGRTFSIWLLHSD